MSRASSSAAKQSKQSKLTFGAPPKNQPKLTDMFSKPATKQQNSQTGTKTPPSKAVDPENKPASLSQVSQKSQKSQKSPVKA